MPTEVGVYRWKATKAELEAGYASELAEAKATHQQHVARLRRQWEKEQKVLSYWLLCLLCMACSPCCMQSQAADLQAPDQLAMLSGCALQ